MAPKATTVELAHDLRLALGLLRRNLRNVTGDEELTLPEASALARLDRGGPATGTALAKAEQISPQAMGTTLAGLEQRGFIGREADPADGRQILLSLTQAGIEALGGRRSARDEYLAAAIESELTASELRSLANAIEPLRRLAEFL
jgi:DNA-binding MarR family transcriptional regulator